MKRRQQVIIARIKELKNLFEEKKVAWEKHPPLARQFKVFLDTFNDMEALNPWKKTETNVLEAQKDELLIKVAKDTYHMAIKIRAFAKMNNNYNLLEVVNNCDTKLDSINKMHLISDGTQLVQAAKDNLPKLEEFDISEEEIESLDLEIQEFRNSDSYNKGYELKVEEQVNFSVLRAKMLVVLDTMDDLVEGIVKDTEFVDQYFKIRFL